MPLSADDIATVEHHLAKGTRVAEIARWYGFTRVDSFVVALLGLRPAGGQPGRPVVAVLPSAAVAVAEIGADRELGVGDGLDLSGLVLAVDPVVESAVEPPLTASEHSGATIEAAPAPRRRAPSRKGPRHAAAPSQSLQPDAREPAAAPAAAEVVRPVGLPARPAGGADRDAAGAAADVGHFGGRVPGAAPAAQPGRGARLTGSRSPAAAIPPARTCQWIEGEPKPDDSCKCGAPSVEGRSYCAEHLRRAYLPAPKRRTAA